MKGALIPLALLSVASASPLNFFARSGDSHAPSKDAKDCNTNGVQIVTKQDGKCLQPDLGRSDDKKEDDKKHRRSNDKKQPEISEGTKVVAVDCKDAPYLWDLPKKEGGAVVLSDYPELAIDAGRHPADGGHLSLYKSNGTPQQQWIINESHQIQLRDGKQCLDAGRNGLQTYTCYKDNKNQEFEVRPVNCPATSAPAKTSEAAKTSVKAETVYKTETKVEAKPTTVYQTKYETKVETKTQPAATVTAPAQTVYKTETKVETKVETKTQPAVTVTAPAQTINKTETKYETKVETKTQPAVTVTAPAQTIHKTEYKTETKTQPAVTVTAPAQTVHKTETKYVDKPTTVKVTETVKASGKPTTLTVVHHPEETQGAGADKGKEQHGQEGQQQEHGKEQQQQPGKEEGKGDQHH